MSSITPTPSNPTNPCTLARRPPQVAATAAGSFAIDITPADSPVVLTASGAAVALAAATTGCPTCSWAWAITGGAGCPVHAGRGSFNGANWTLSAGANAASDAINTASLGQGTLDCSAVVTATDAFSEQVTATKAIRVSSLAGASGLGRCPEHRQTILAAGADMPACTRARGRGTGAATCALWAAPLPHRDRTAPQVVPPQPPAPALTVASTPVVAGETVVLNATGSTCQARALRGSESALAPLTQAAARRLE